jgi:hypothetical protein
LPCGGANVAGAQQETVEQMTTIDVGNNDRLDFEPARDALRLTPAVGGWPVTLTISSKSWS